MNSSFLISKGSCRLAFSVVFIISFTFAAYTNHAWEDWFITYRAAKNLAIGNGLVFTVGERVHSFTSPLGTLVPAFLNLVSGNRSDDLVLWLFRIFSCTLLGFSGCLLLRIARAAGMSLFPLIIMLGMFALDARIIDFSINGMETALMIFFLLVSLDALLFKSERYKLKLGISWAALMWTRPDAFVYFGGLAVGVLLFNPASGNYSNRREIWSAYLYAAAVAAALYLPWILFAWNYYGSPVPHTIIAKSLFRVKPDLSLITKFLTFPIRSIFETTAINYTFMPPYYIDSRFPDAAIIAAKIPALLCNYYWIVPFARRDGRAISFGLFFSSFYLTSISANVAPWYVPNMTLMAIVVIGLISQQIAANLSIWENQADSNKLKSLKWLFHASGICALLLTSALTAAAAYQVKLQQEILEDGHRKQIGLWLRDNASTPKDTVFVECLGYVGFFSQLKMLDWPGLSSPEVVAASKKLNSNDYALLIDYLKPDWLVLRPNEVAYLEQKMPELLAAKYREVKLFDVSDKIAAHAFLPDRNGFLYDQTFIVYRRTTPS